MRPKIQHKRDIIRSIVAPEVSDLELDSPRDFRESDDWNQFRLENTADACSFCEDSSVLHLHHTCVPPDVSRMMFELPEEMFIELGGAGEHLRDPERRCNGCAALNCDGCGDVGDVTRQELVEKLSVHSIFCNSYEGSVVDDFERFVEENVDDIVNRIKEEWQQYLRDYEKGENTITLCARCHYLRHRYDCKPCKEENCKRITPEASRYSRYANSSGGRICGVCLSVCSNDEWEEMIDELLSDEYDDSYFTLDEKYRWSTTYDEIWDAMASNNDVIE